MIANLPSFPVSEIIEQQLFLEELRDLVYDRYTQLLLKVNKNEKNESSV